MTTLFTTEGVEPPKSWELEKHLEISPESETFVANLFQEVEQELDAKNLQLGSENLLTIKGDLELEPKVSKHPPVQISNKLLDVTRQTLPPKLRKAALKSLSGMLLAAAIVGCTTVEPKKQSTVVPVGAIYENRQEPPETITEIFPFATASILETDTVSTEIPFSTAEPQVPVSEAQMNNENVLEHALKQNEQPYASEKLKHTLTPPSLMLHSANLPQLEELIPLLDEYSPITYEEYYLSLLKGETIENPLLISIDDLGTSWLRGDFKEMIKKFKDRGIVGTLGINTTGSRNEAKESIWEYLRELSDAGWELALHSEGHLNLPSLSDSELRNQIVENYNEIKLNTGQAPKTLILPFGSINDPKTGKPDKRIFDICRELEIVWVVGISDGKSFGGDEQSPPYFIGRIPPGENAEITIRYLQNSFGK